MTDILKISIADSRSTVVVSARGHITLPAELRHRLGIKEGGVVTREERNGELVLRPAAVVELTMYSAEDVAHWDVEDHTSQALGSGSLTLKSSVPSPPSTTRRTPFCPSASVEPHVTL